MYNDHSEQEGATVESELLRLEDPTETTGDVENALKGTGEV